MNRGIEREEAAATPAGVTRRGFCAAAALSPLTASRAWAGAAPDAEPLQIPLAMSEAVDPQFVTPLLRLIELWSFCDMCDHE